MIERLQLKKTPGWRGRFASTMCLDGAKEFQWGEFDCLRGLVAPAILAQTGVDIMGLFRQYAYSCAEEARSHIRAAGLRDVADVMAALLPEIHPSRLCIGDIAAVDSGDGAVGLGVCCGAHIMVLSPKGKGSVRLLAATRGFKVG